MPREIQKEKVAKIVFNRVIFAPSQHLIDSMEAWFKNEHARTDLDTIQAKVEQMVNDVGMSKTQDTKFYEDNYSLLANENPFGQGYYGQHEEKKEIFFKLDLNPWL